MPRDKFQDQMKNS